MSPALLIFYLFLLFLVVFFFTQTVKIIYETERAVVFTLGRFWKVKGPGLILLIPIVQTMRRISIQTITLDVPPQDVITQDNVTVKVNAVTYFRVVDPRRALIQVEDYYYATQQLAQTTLRSVIGQHTLDQLLSERDQLNQELQKVLDLQTDNWGIKVSQVEIKDVDLNESMVRSIAKQAEAERDRRAKVIHAEGELQASKKLTDAANVLSHEPNAILLRFLQTATNIAEEKNSVLLFPIPIELMGLAKDRIQSATTPKTAPKTRKKVDDTNH